MSGEVRENAGTARLALDYLDKMGVSDLCLPQLSIYRSKLTWRPLVATRLPVICHLGSQYGRQLQCASLGIVMTAYRKWLSDPLTSVTLVKSVFRQGL